MSELLTPLRFAGVGLVCALLHNAIVIGFDRAGMHYVAACVVSYMVVIVVGFCLHVRVTFGVPASVPSFGRYALAMALNVPLSIALIWLLHDVFGLSIPISSPIATITLIAGNFVASRWAVVPATRVTHRETAA